MDTAHALSHRLASLYRNERNAMADFLIALADFDENGAWREIGYPSLWTYLRRELKLSKGAAFQRKTAADLVQSYPAVSGALRSGELCLSTVTILARVLTPANAAEVLPRFFGLSHREAEALSASLRPAEVIPTRDVVRLLLPRAPSSSAPVACPASPPCHPALPPAMAETKRGPELALAAVVPTSEPLLPVRVPPSPAPSESTRFLDADRARISVTVPRRVLDKLQAAKDALAHVVPDGDLAVVLEHALDLVLRESRKKRALVDRPRKASKPPMDGSRHVPAEVARAVWTRSGGRCESTLPDGGRCGSTHGLELDHITPRATGGQPTVENLRVACRDCNQLAARRAFGNEVVDHCAGRKGRRRVAGAASLPLPGALGSSG
jgi:5-methylcytosine-specific restriction endonuclease McrA